MIKNIHRSLLKDIIVFKPSNPLSIEGLTDQISDITNTAKKDMLGWSTATYYGTKTPVNKLTNIEMLSIVAPHIFNSHLLIIISRIKISDFLIKKSPALLCDCCGIISNDITKEELTHCVELVRKYRKAGNLIKETGYLDLIDLAVDKNYEYEQALESFVKTSRILKERVSHVKSIDGIYNLQKNCSAPSLH